MKASKALTLLAFIAAAFDAHDILINGSVASLTTELVILISASWICRAIEGK